MAKATTVNVGNVINFNNDMYEVTSIEHVKSHKQGGGAYCIMKLRNLKKGGTIVNRFNSGDNLDICYIDNTSLEYLYRDTDGYVFMDSKTYEQYTVSEEMLGENIKWLRSNMKVRAKMCEGLPVVIEMPSYVMVKVVNTIVASRGDTVKQVLKPATTDTGAEVKVPSFIEQGEWIKVDPTTGEFQSRVSANEIPEE